MSDDAVTVLLVEDHLALRKGMELLLRARGLRVVGVAGTAEAGYRLYEARRPDVAVIDATLDASSGMTMAQRILELDPEAGVLLYTGATDPAVISAAAACGARGFALKAGGPDELIGAIHTVAAGGVYVDPTVAAMLAPRAAPRRMLTRREVEVLERLASGMTGEQAAATLGVSPETVRTHIRNAMRKLDARTRVHAVTLALGLGEISTTRDEALPADQTAASSV
jgi:DNA-binding NarL/FixJ family response regulator